ncbi:MAG: hypothetical protein Fur006_31980 [Coleofasciculaceae cyanobacterium]
MQTNNRLLEETSSQTQEFYFQFLADCQHIDTQVNIYTYLSSMYGAWKHRKYFEQIEKYCMFIGCGRTGHSLVGACLDAHPDMVISDELGAVKYINKRSYSQEQIYYLILKQSQVHAREGRTVAGYSYAVPNQWQGRFRDIKIIGDKEAAPTTAILQSNPGLLDVLYEKVGAPINFIHVIRNPYDVIATFTKREQINIETAIELYFLVCKAVTELKTRIDKDKILEITNESFIANPKHFLKQTCDFLSIHAPDDYLEDCASIVYDKPHKSRFNIQWNSDLIDLVRKRIIDKYPFLTHYSYQG